MMKFLVSDSQASRHERIRSYLTQETAVIAIVLAAVDFEWTVRRILDHRCADVSQAATERHISGLNGYASVWARAFKGLEGGRLEAVVGEWDNFKEAYQLRHDVIHGKQGSSGLAYVSPRVERILAASKAATSYGQKNGADAYKRLRIRSPLTSPKQRAKT